jgi:hypothetical protein
MTWHDGSAAQVVKRGTLAAILRQAGIDAAEFADLHVQLGRLADIHQRFLNRLALADCSRHLSHLSDVPPSGSGVSTAASTYFCAMTTT